MGILTRSGTLVGGDILTRIGTLVGEDKWIFKPHLRCLCPQ